MATATWVKSMLEQQGVAFEELHHPAAFTAQEVAQREHVSGHRLAKVVAVMADGRLVELIVPASRRVALDRVRELLGAGEVRLASEAELATFFTDCETGAIPPLRHWGGVEILMDAAMLVEGEILFQAGTHEDVIRLKFDDWFRMMRPRVESFSEPESVAHRPTFACREDEGAVPRASRAGGSEVDAEASDRESGLPGGGRGRVDEVGRTGVYPASGPFPSGPAEIRTPGTWVHGQRDESGREVEGGSEIIFFQGKTLLGGATPPPSGPPEAPKPAPGPHP
jgi:Ala-tRNA(Pro) deacylase